LSGAAGDFQFNGFAGNGALGGSDRGTSFTVSCGQTSNTNLNGGEVKFTTGDFSIGNAANDGSGGDFIINTGESRLAESTSHGGSFVYTGGAAEDGHGGEFNVTTGSSVSGDGGDVLVITGSGGVEGGDVFIRPGAGATQGQRGVTEFRGAWGSDFVNNGTIALAGGTFIVEFAITTYVRFLWGPAATGTIDLGSVKTDVGITALLEIENGGQGTLGFGTMVTFGAAGAPTLTAAGKDLLRFITRDGGTTWVGEVVALDF
jgi:hypothetical protein